MTDLLARPAPLSSGTCNELEPPTLTLDSTAKARWVLIHNAIESDMRDRGEYASVRAWAAKAPAQVLRIAAVLTVFGDPDAATIRAETVDRAAELVMFALGEAVRIVGTAAVPIEIRHAEALLAWCHTDRSGLLLHSAAALRLGPSDIRTKAAFDAAIAVLERAGWATSIQGGAEVDGVHRRRVWRIEGARPSVRSAICYVRSCESANSPAAPRQNSQDSQGGEPENALRGSPSVTSIWPASALRPERWRLRASVVASACSRCSPRRRSRCATPGSPTRARIPTT